MRLGCLSDNPFEHESEGIASVNIAPRGLSKSCGGGSGTTLGRRSTSGSLAKFAAMRSPKAGTPSVAAMGAPTLGAQGRRRKRRTKTRCLGKSRSTPVPNIPPHFEIKVTAVGPFYFPRSSSGSLAKLAAMRRASSLVRKLGRRAPTGLLLEIEIAERLPGRVADDEARVVVLLDGPGWREAARHPSPSGLSGG